MIKRSLSLDVLRSEDAARGGAAPSRHSMRSGAALRGDVKIVKSI